jgi:hypothetical protein
MRCAHAAFLAIGFASASGAQDSRRLAVKACESRLRTQLSAARSGNQTFHLDVTGPGGARLRYFGARHTYDSTDAQVGEIEAAWREVHPTVAFFEGTGTFIGATPGTSIARSTEAGLIRFLAARDSIPARSLEPPLGDEVRELLSSFSAEQIALFYVTRPITQYRDAARRGGRVFGRLQLDSVLPRLVTLVGETRPLADAVPDVAAYHAAFSHWFPGLDPTDTPGQWFNPERTAGETGSKFLNDVNRASSAFRDLHMYRLLASTSKPSVRILAVVGRAHVAAQAEALRCALKVEG